MATEAVETKTGSVTPERVRARRDKLDADESPLQAELKTVRDKLEDIQADRDELQDEICEHPNPFKYPSNRRRTRWHYECPDCGCVMGPQKGAVEVADPREPAEGGAP